MPVYVTRPHLPDIERLRLLLDEIYTTGQLTNDGPLLRRFTHRLESFLGVKNLLLVSSGTMALQLALKLLEVESEVVTTPFSFPATTSSILWEGASPVFADIDAADWNIDPECVAKAINSKTAAILATHVFGNACLLSELNSISQNNGVPLVYDAAHAFGVGSQGSSILNYGDISIVSFHATKLFHSVEGGALVIRDDSLFERAKSLINFGIVGEGEICDIGINGKLSEMHAAMGLLVLEDFEQIQGEYAAAYRFYDRHLNEHLIRQTLTNSQEYNHSYFPILFENEEQVLLAISALNAREIYPRRYFFPSLDTIQAYGAANNCPVSQSVASRILCLPMSHDLTEDIQRVICTEINSIFTHA